MLTLLNHICTLIFLGMGLFFLYKKNRSTQMLGIFLLIQGVANFIMFFNISNFVFKFPYLIFTAIPLRLLWGPTLMLFVGYFLDQNYKFKKWYLIHTVPFFVSILFIGFQYYNYGQEFTDLYLYQRDLFLERYEFTNHVIFGHNLVYLIFGFITIILKYVNQDSPNWVKDKKKLLWIIYGLTLIILGHMYVPILYYVTKIEFKNFIFLVQFPLLSFLFFSIFKFPYFINNNQNENIGTTQIVEIDSVNLLKGKIIEIMETQKPHLNPNLTLKALADLAEIQSYQLSELLNKYFDKNFNEFVNYYRIEESKSQLKSSINNQYSLEGIGRNCGFKSKSTFFTTFKKLTGLTPSEFKKQNVP